MESISEHIGCISLGPSGDQATDIPQDILSEIISHVTTGSTYKACALVSRAWHNAARANSHMIESLTNQLVTLLLHAPNERWQHEFISRHPLITPEFILAHPDWGWNWLDVARNPNITMQDIGCMMNRNYTGLSQNINITPEFILAHVDDLNWFFVSQNEAIDMDFVISHPELPWKWPVSQNPSISMEIIVANPAFPWDWPLLSQNPSISIEIIVANPAFPWDWPRISHRITSTELLQVVPHDAQIDWYWISTAAHVDLNIMKKYIDLWDWTGLSFNTSVTIDIILEYADRSWTWRDVSQYSKITIEHVLAHPEILWCWIGLSANPSIIISDEDLRTLPWDWYFLSKNPAISLDMIKNNPTCPWIGSDLSSNPNITAAFVISRLDIEWDYSRLSINSFGNVPNLSPTYDNI
jgi:hypothetical protein